MKNKFKKGDRVIVIKTPTLIEPKFASSLVGKVFTIDHYQNNIKRYALKEYNFIAIAEENLTAVVSYPEVEEIIADRFWEKEEYRLRQFVVGVIGVVFFVIGLWFISECGNSVINFFTGTIALAGATFCGWTIKNSMAEKRSLKSDFNKKIQIARFNDLTN